MKKKQKTAVVGRPPKLTIDQVLEIREWDTIRQALPSLEQIAKAYGVHKTTISALLRADYMHYVN